MGLVANLQDKLIDLTLQTDHDFEFAMTGCGILACIKNDPMEELLVPDRLFLIKSHRRISDNLAYQFHFYFQLSNGQTITIQQSTYHKRLSCFWAPDGDWKTSCWWWSKHPADGGRHHPSELMNEFLYKWYLYGRERAK